MTDIGTFNHDDLLGGSKKLVTEDVLLAAGNLLRGSVLGRVKQSTPTTGAADGGNTGDGTVTVVTGGGATKQGTYTVKCTEAITNGGRFEITGPDGFVGTALITAGAGGTAVFVSEQINLTITDGSTDFALADLFTIVVTEGVPNTGTADGGNTGNGTVTVVEGRRGLKIGTYTVECTVAVTNGGTFKVTNPDSADIQTGIVIPVGAGNDIAFANDEIAGLITDGSTDFAVGDKFTIATTINPRQVLLLDKAATDGSSEPYAILTEDKDASVSAQATIGYLSGQFNERKLIFAAGTDIEDVRDKMRDLGMDAVASSSVNQ